jgi:hypothetical protein
MRTRPYVVFIRWKRRQCGAVGNSVQCLVRYLVSVVLDVYKIKPFNQIRYL